MIMEFHMSDDSPLSLVEMRFHVPHTNPVLAQDEAGENVEQESIGPDPVKELHDKILAKADVIQATGDAIVTFAEIHCLTPRLVMHVYRVRKIYICCWLSLHCWAVGLQIN